MEDLLELYEAPLDKAEPVVCLDERPIVLHDEKRQSRPMRSGKPLRVDYEYVRCGTANAFCIVEPKAGRHMVLATKCRKGRDFAQALSRVNRRYRNARKIHLVLDNLSTHSKKSVVDRFGAERGEQLWSRFKFHFTPKHASWLNQAEIQIGMLSRECLQRRISNMSMLVRETKAWAKSADRDRRVFRWGFTRKKARKIFRYQPRKRSRNSLSEH